MLTDGGTAGLAPTADAAVTIDHPLEQLKVFVIDVHRTWTFAINKQGVFFDDLCFALWFTLWTCRTATFGKCHTSKISLQVKLARIASPGLCLFWPWVTSGSECLICAESPTKYSDAKSAYLETATLAGKNRSNRRESGAFVSKLVNTIDKVVATKTTATGSIST